MAEMNDVLLQYGAVGIIALMSLAAVRVLFKREIAAHEQETARANRLEAELKQLNETVQNQYITTLTQATVALSSALDFLREVGANGRTRRDN